MSWKLGKSNQNSDETRNTIDEPQNKPKYMKKSPIKYIRDETNRTLNSSQNEIISDESDLDFDDFQVVDEVDEAESRVERRLERIENEFESNIKSKSGNQQSSYRECKNDNEGRANKDKLVQNTDNVVQKNPKESETSPKNASSSRRHTAIGVASYLKRLKENPVKKETKNDQSVKDVPEQQQKSINREVHSPGKESGCTERYTKSHVKNSRSPVRRAMGPVMGPISRVRSPVRGQQGPMRNARNSIDRKRNQQRFRRRPNRNFKSPPKEGKNLNIRQHGSPVRDGYPIEQTWDQLRADRSLSIERSPVRTVRYGSPDEPRNLSHGSDSQYRHHSPPTVTYPPHSMLQGENIYNSRNRPVDGFPVKQRYNKQSYDEPQRYVNQEIGRSLVGEKNPLRHSPNGSSLHRSRSPGIYEKNRSLSSHGNFERKSPYRYGNQGSPDLSQERHPFVGSLERFSPSRGNPQKRVSNVSPPISRSPYRNRSQDRLVKGRRSPYRHPSREIIGRNLSRERVERFSPARGRSPVRQMSLERHGRFSPPRGRSPTRKISLEGAGRYSPTRGKERFGKFSPHGIGSSKRRVSKDRFERVTPPSSRSPRKTSTERIDRFSPHRGRSPPRKPGKERLEGFAQSRVRSPQNYKAQFTRSPIGRRSRNSEDRDYSHKERSNLRSPLRSREDMKSPFEPSSKKYRSSISRRSRSLSVERNKGIDEATQQAIEDMKKIHNRECQRYRENPSAHPDYSVEYRKFCEAKTRKVIELGGDPTCYDFVTEWNTLWPKRMNELFKESWLSMKEHSLKLMSEKNKNKQAKMSSKAQGYSSTSKDRMEFEPNMEKKKFDEKIPLYFKEKPQRESRDMRVNTSKGSMKKYSTMPTEVVKKDDDNKDDLGLEEIGDSILDEVGESFSPKSKSIKSEKSSENVVSSTTSSEDINVNIIDLIKIFCKMDDMLGSLGPPIKELYIKGIEWKANGVDCKKLLEDADTKMLLEMVSSKLTSLSKYDTTTSVQRIVFQEAKERLDKVLQKTDQAVYKEGLDIPGIAQATLGKETGEIVTFLKNALKYLGYEEHYSGFDDKLMKSYLEVREAQLKLQ